MKVLIASKNMGKIEIYGQIFKELDMEWCSLRDIDVNINVEETADTTTENAIIKAKAYHDATSMPVLCNDSGLIIEKLKPEDQPGVLVRRYGGKELTDEQTIKIFKHKLDEVGGESDAYFNVSLAIINQNGLMFVKDFKSYRFMTSKESRSRIKGLPLRSLDYDKATGKYMSEMTIEEANRSEGECIQNQKKFIIECFK